MSKIKAKVTLKISGGTKEISKEFDTHKDAEAWVKSMSKNKAVTEIDSPTIGMASV